MRAIFINENDGDYPPGAKYDKDAPYNEGDDKSFVDVTLTDDNEIQLERKVYVDEDDTETIENDIIDPGKMNEFLADAFEVDYEETIEIEDVIQHGDDCTIVTDRGEVKITIEGLYKLAEK
jgi:hypothetical protein